MDNYDRLLNTHSKLIYDISKKFYNIDKKDLYNAGVIGLINAYNNYNDSNKVKFSTYAYQYIFGEMYKLMKSECMVKDNEYYKMKKLINKTINYLTQLYKKEVSIKDISLYLELDEVLVSSVINYDNMNSIDDLLFLNDNRSNINDDYIELVNMINDLNEPDRSIMKYRYMNDLSQEMVAKILGLNQTKVSRIEKDSINRLRKSLV